MKSDLSNFNVAILGCGTVGGGVARILLDLSNNLEYKAGRKIVLNRIVDLFPQKASARHAIPLELFYGSGKDLGTEQAAAAISEVISDPDIDLVVETIGGTSRSLQDVCAGILKNGKHLVTANKALLAEFGEPLFSQAAGGTASLAYEAAVCGAIPLIRTVREGFAGDEILSVSGIMNGTSNYILSRMQEENLSFNEALGLAQEAGYAEADPTLDIGGGDAGHKLSLLMRLAFGLPIGENGLSIQGIQEVDRTDIRTARELDCSIKLICHAQIDKSTSVPHVFAAVTPMMVKNNNVLSRIGGATNAVRFLNRFSDEHILVGKGAGSSETGSAIVADIVALARYGSKAREKTIEQRSELRDLNELPFPYTVIFDTEDVPGITGLVATAIGDQGINIDTVGHNLHGNETAVFCVKTMPCTRNSIKKAVEAIRNRRPGILQKDPKIYPVLY